MPVDGYQSATGNDQSGGPELTSLPPPPAIDSRIVRQAHRTPDRPSPVPSYHPDGSTVGHLSCRLVTLQNRIGVMKRGKRELAAREECEQDLSKTVSVDS